MKTDSNPVAPADDIASLPTVGWREYVDFPEWEITRVRAKIDTGARTSAIHVANIEQVDDEHIRFEVVTRERPERKTHWVTAPLAREARVKPSSGKSQRRPVVKTIMRIGSVEREIEISLVGRKGMLCRMLVGRTALADTFVVNPAERYVLSKPRRKRKKKKE